MPYATARVAPGRLILDGSLLNDAAGVFVEAPGAERPIYVSRGPSGGVSAVLASCTHRGCQPEPVADRLICPCHGSEFTADGEVLEGPADRPLVRYEVTSEQGDLVIHLVEEGAS